ncbi:synaptobrevin [Caerostris extrusa]|uniref:Synaptobrevin n=1 Tax=Caerostris extrusa TaxID=172846 RepID=A0AAV4M3B6_CAEEX|nr:synaptobrevin [Caerostris extrusa]
MENGNEPAPPQEENPQHKVAHKRMQETRAQIDEQRVKWTSIPKLSRKLAVQVTTWPQVSHWNSKEKCRFNIAKGRKLSDLDDRADALKDEASEFGKQTGKLKRKYWWKKLQNACYSHRYMFCGDHNNYRLEADFTAEKLSDETNYLPRLRKIIAVFEKGF